MKAIHDFFKGLLESWKNNSKEPFDENIKLAGRSISIFYSNQAHHTQLFRALNHLPKGGSNSDLSVYVWSSSLISDDFPSLEFDGFCSKEVVKERWGFNLVNTDFNQPILIFLRSPTPCITAFYPDHKVAFVCYDNLSAVPYWEKAAPMRYLFDWWCQSENLVFTHGAVVGKNEEGILLVGKGGQGKSTSAISCLFSEELKYVGDDYVILVDDIVPKAYSVYNSGKLHFDHMSHIFPSLKPFCTNLNTGDDKAILFFNDYLKEKIALEMNIIALALPQVRNLRSTGYKLCSPKIPKINLISSTVYQSTMKNKIILEELSKVVAKLPSYSLSIGSNVDEIPRTVVQLLENAQVR